MPASIICTIRDRLPHEVLNISGRLYAQCKDSQAVLDNIHGEISKLTATIDGKHGCHTF
jgi:hypothetical protein